MKRLLPLIIVSLLPLSCNPIAVKSVTDLATLGIKVVTLLQGCSDLCDAFSIKVAQVNSGMETGIKEGRSIVELGRYWENYWGDVHDQYNDLVDNLNQTNVLSREYFLELNRNNSGISDATLKQQDLEQTTQVRAKYDAEFEKAVNAINEAKVMLQKGDDLMLVLRNNVLRNAIEGQIVTLNEITKQSKTLSQNIDTFSKNCIPLFESNK